MALTPITGRELNRRRTVKRSALLLLVFVAAGFAGCSMNTQPKPLRIGDEQRFLVHLVRTNEETVGRVARWYTGSDKLVKELLSLNSRSTSNGLQVGESVLIPFSALRTVVPLPKQVAPKKKRSPPRRMESAETVPAEEEVLVEEQTSVSPEEIRSNPQLPAPLPSVSSSEEQQDEGKHNSQEVVTLPSESTQPQTAVQDAPLGAGTKSIEDLVKEEQAELERLKSELEPPS